MLVGTHITNTVLQSAQPYIVSTHNDQGSQQNNLLVSPALTAPIPMPIYDALMLPAHHRATQQPPSTINTKYWFSSRVPVSAVTAVPSPGHNCVCRIAHVKSSHFNTTGNAHYVKQLEC
jgi:hypothetical protein